MSVILMLTVIISILSVSVAQQNYALSQPTNQYTTTPGGYTSNNAVDGNLGTPSATNIDYTAPFRTWWTVKLSRWIRITSFRIYWRPGPADRRDVGYSYLAGSFWNLSLTGDVANGAINYDPIADGIFSLLYTQTSSMFDMSDTLMTINVTAVATGRYFAARAGSVLPNVILFEVQVFGQPNQLMATVPTLIVADPTPYVSYNYSKLTDEDENTCLTMLNQSSSRNVFLRFASTPTGRFVVAVHSRGTLRPLQRGGDQCNTGKFLVVSMARQSNGITSDYFCKFNDQRADGVKSYFTFVCDCSDCLSGVKVWLSQQISDNTDAAQLCEILLFNY